MPPLFRFFFWAADLVSEASPHLATLPQVIILSGSEKGRLEEVFGETDAWLGAENGTVLRSPLDKVGVWGRGYVCGCVVGSGGMGVGVGHSVCRCIYVCVGVLCPRGRC
jgi:hypothetical protein